LSKVRASKPGDAGKIKRWESSNLPSWLCARECERIQFGTSESQFFLTVYLISCSDYPQGRICIWVAVSAVVTYAASVNVTSGCYYVKVDDVFPDYDGVYVGYGGVEHLPPVDENAYCESWTQTQKDLIWDGPWKTGFAFSILASIFAGVPMVVSFFFACFSFDLIWNKICACMMIMSSLFTWLSYIGFAAGMCENGNCTFSIGAGLALVSGLTALLTAWLFLRIPAYQEPIFGPSDVVTPGADLAPGTVQVTELVLPDGTKKTVRTTVHQDGSRTVEETVETPAEGSTAAKASGETPAEGPIAAQATGETPAEEP
jgi:hypothetical protein